MDMDWCLFHGVEIVPSPPNPAPLSYYPRGPGSSVVSPVSRSVSVSSL